MKLLDVLGLLVIDSGLLLDQLLKYAPQVLDLQQGLLVLDVPLDRESIWVRHQIVQLLLQVDLVVQLIVSLNRQCLLFNASLLGRLFVVEERRLIVIIINHGCSVLLLVLRDRDGLSQKFSYLPFLFG